MIYIYELGESRINFADSIRVSECSFLRNFVFITLLDACRSVSVPFFFPLFYIDFTLYLSEIQITARLYYLEFHSSSSFYNLE
jgi:hypothetical protein